MENLKIENLTIAELQELLNLLYLSAHEFWESEGIDGFTDETRKRCDELLKKVL
jgi:hypothetical protein